MDISPASLVYVDDTLPGITRRRAGRGWVYRSADGARITDRAEIARLNGIGLPPAYGNAWFCPDPRGHLQATGIDARGRKQYRYHPAFRAARESEKFDGCARFGSLLPLVRKRVEADMARGGLNRDRVLACVVRLLDLGAVRIGNEAYARANESFGATTLRSDHATVRGATLRLSFRAKSGRERSMAITDRRLAMLVRRMQDLPGQRLFQYPGPDGEVCAVGSAEVNAYLCETMGERYTAKNFRTWHASVLAFERLSTATEAVGMRTLLADVAERLGNTPAVARRSYIHPAVLSLVATQGEWRPQMRLPRPTRWLTRAERGLIAWLQDSPPASALLAA